MSTGDLGIELDLLAQPADLVVDAAVERLGVAADRQIEELVAGQHQAGVVEEGASRRNSAVLERHGDPS